MKRNFFIFCASFLFLFLSFNNAFADSSDPKQFIQEIVDEAKEILVDSNSEKYKAEKLTEIALQTVDIKGVGSYTLGSYRKNLSEEEKKNRRRLAEHDFCRGGRSDLLIGLGHLILWITQGLQLSADDNSDSDEEDSDED